MPNKHESLYCCTRRGANYYIINTTQLLYVICTLFFSYKLAGFLSDTAIGMVLFILALGINIYVWFWVMPDMLDAYALTTSVSNSYNDYLYVIDGQIYNRLK